MQNAYIIVALFIMLISSIAVLCNHLENEGEKLAKTHGAASHVFPHPFVLDKNSWSYGVLPQMSELMSVNAYYNHYTANSVSPGYKKQARQRVLFTGKIKWLIPTGVAAFQKPMTVDYNLWLQII